MSAIINWVKRISAKKIICIFMLFGGVFSFLSGQESAVRENPIDLVLVLDTSSGMSGSYQELRDYLAGPFLSEFLRIGDTFHFISFSDKARIEIARRIEGIGDVETIIGRIFLMYPLDPDSDITGALKYTEDYISFLPGTRQKKVVFFSNGDSFPGNSGQTAAGVQNFIGENTSRFSRLGAELRYVAVPLTERPSSGRLAARTPPASAVPPARTPSVPPAAAVPPVSAVPPVATAPVPPARGNEPLREPSPGTPPPASGGTAAPAGERQPAAAPPVASTPPARTPSPPPASAAPPVAAVPPARTPSPSAVVPPARTPSPSAVVPPVAAAPVPPARGNEPLREPSPGTPPPASGGAAAPAGERPPAAAPPVPATPSARTPSPPAWTLSVPPAVAAPSVPERPPAAAPPVSAAPVLPAPSAGSPGVPPEGNRPSSGSVPAPEERRGSRDGPGSSPEVLPPPSPAPARPAAGSADTGRAAGWPGGIFGLSLPLLIGLAVLAVLLLGLIIFLITGRLHRSPNRAMAHAALPRRNGEEKPRVSGDKNAELFADYAAAQRRRKTITPRDISPGTSSLKETASGPSQAEPYVDALMLSLFVEDQTTSIGKRNIHTVKPGYTFTIGGGKSDFLIFLVSIPPRIAEIRFNGRNCTFFPRKPQFFPDLGSREVPNCIGKTIRVISEKDYELNIRIERYEDPLIALNRLLHSVNLPG